MRGSGIVGVAIGVQALLAPSAAAAADLSPADVIAAYCGDDQLECASAPLVFEKTIEQPVAFNFDTGWIPQNSSLQVRFFVTLPASTTVALDGALETRWPDAMRLATPGGPGGLLAFDYGLEVGAKAKVDVNVLGVPVSWTGNIPFLPQVDFRMTGETSFRSWAFPGNESPEASGITEPVRLFEVNLLSLAGIPSQISKGGIALDVRGELGATYRTDRIRIEPADDGAPIESENGQTDRPFAGGAFVEYDVWPEGTVSYTGTLHLVPTFFVKVLTKDFSLPVFDLPVSLDLLDQEFVFDPVRVHVPLPDLTPATPEVLDFGPVNIGDGRVLEIALENIGEARARATGFVDSEHSNVFELVTPELLVDPGAEGALKVRFKPAAEGVIETELTLVTNDPDARFQSVLLRATAVTEGAPHYGELGPPGREQDGSCACSAPGTPERGAFGALGVVLALSLFGRRRMRRNCPSQPRRLA